MKKAALHLFLALLLISTLGSAQEADPPLAEGVMTGLAGTVQLSRAPAKPRTAKKGDVVYGGDILETGADGKVTVTLVDGSVLEVRSNSRVQINDSRLNPRGSSSVVLFVGWLWAKVTAVSETDYAFEVEAPTSVAGVRGTELVVAVAEDGSTRVGVSKGRVVMEGEDEEELRLSPGMTGESSYRTGLSTGAPFNSVAEVWEAWLSQHSLVQIARWWLAVADMVTTALSAREELLDQDQEFREEYQQYQARREKEAEEEPEPEPKPAPKSKPLAPEEKPAPPAKDDRQETAKKASEVRSLSLAARSTQKAADRMAANYYLAERAKTLAAQSPQKLTQQEAQDLNRHWAKLKDVPQLQSSANSVLRSYGAAIEYEVGSYDLHVSLGRMPPMQRNAQINQILKQVPGAMPPMPSTQTLPKPVMPRIPTLPRQP